MQSSMQQRLGFGTATATLGHVFITVKLYEEHHAQWRGTAKESRQLQPRQGMNSTILSSTLMESSVTKLSLLLAVLNGLNLIISPNTEK